MVTPLSNREALILQYLANGKTYAEILATINTARGAKQKPPMSLNNLHATCALIRQKTGLRDTKNPLECRAIFRQRHSTLVERSAHPLPTRRQLQVLRMVAAGKPYVQIAQAMELTSHQSVQNYASQACQRIGIQVEPYQRTYAIRKWLEEHDARRLPPAAPADPMNDPMF